MSTVLISIGAAFILLFGVYCAALGTWQRFGKPAMESECDDPRCEQPARHFHYTVDEYLSTEVITLARCDRHAPNSAGVRRKHEVQPLTEEEVATLRAPLLHAATQVEEQARIQLGTATPDNLGGPRPDVRLYPYEASERLSGRLEENTACVSYLRAWGLHAHADRLEAGEHLAPTASTYAGANPTGVKAASLFVDLKADIPPSLDGRQ
jgi:hypothetical protein